MRFGGLNLDHNPGVLLSLTLFYSDGAKSETVGSDDTFQGAAVECRMAPSYEFCEAPWASGRGPGGIDGIKALSLTFVPNIDWNPPKSSGLHHTKIGVRLAWCWTTSW